MIKAFITMADASIAPTSADAAQNNNEAADLLSKSYDPKAVEASVYEFWESSKRFKPESGRNDSGKNFSIVIPPPNVTGVLHMGHALDNTIQDILTRWHRMLGDKTLWMPGTDHAGIATQNVVERNLKQSGQTKESLGREAFLKVIWEWVDARKSDILNQFRRLGVSPDWERQRFTLDEGLSKAVRQAFVTLYHQDLIYQGTYVVNWCPRCASAISDIETEYVDEESFLWEIAYPLTDGSGSLIVATTRPETMFGDVAVAVNPEDTRYQRFIGKTVTLPLSNREIPVIADNYVDTAFGTGALKITPAHDPNDFKIGQQHNLAPIWVLDVHGKLKAEDAVPKALQGLDRVEARKKTEALLQEEGYLVRKVEHTHRVGHCQRCQTTIEPLLSKQWFVKTQPLADQCLQALEEEKIRFIPERWTKDYVRWLTDIQDWCISRQLWWGHQIPAWHCQDCHQVIVPKSADEPDPTACEHCASNQIVQDPDVLDTWFSSGLWPFSTMGWPNKDAHDFKDFYPTDVLVTGFDIIFFWVARMTMFAHQLTGKSPFHTVYIHGLIRDDKGQKMSKSKGNVVDPVQLIDELGCDGFRFALTSLITYGGQDIKLAKDKLELGRVFSNKLWNASRFVLMNLEAGEFPAVDDNPVDRVMLSDMDRWILSRYHQTVDKVNGCLAEYRFGEYADTMYEFVWNNFCDWYVEYAKKQLKENELVAQNTKRVLLEVLSGIMRMLHPMMPYITEAIYQKLPHKVSESIMVDRFPTSELALIDNTLNERVDFILETVRAIRNIRQQYNVPHPQGVNVVIEAPEELEFQAFQVALPIIQHFVRVDKLDVKNQLSGQVSHAAVNLVRHSRVMVPLEGLIDVKQEAQRLNKKHQALQKEQEQIYKMLSNFDFLEKAPEDVVEKNKARLQEVNQQLKVLEEQLQSLT